MRRPESRTNAPPIRPPKVEDGEYKDCTEDEGAGRGAFAEEGKGHDLLERKVHEYVSYERMMG